MLKILTSAKTYDVSSVLQPVISRYSGLPHEVVLFSAGGNPSIVSGDLVVGMGSGVLDMLKAAGAVPKNRSLTASRSTPIVHEEVTYLMTYDPYGASKDYNTRINIELDVAAAIRLHNTGTLVPALGDYRWAQNYDHLISYIKQAHKDTGKAVDVTTDLETVGLDEWDPDAWVVSISFTAKEGTAELIGFPGGHDDQPEDFSGLLYMTPEQTVRNTLWHQIKWLLTTPMISLKGANLKFDLRWMRHKWGIVCTNMKFDTVLVGSLLDENRSNSLNVHAKMYTDIGGYDDPFNAAYDKGKMAEHLINDPEGFKVYAGGDTDACLKVFHKEKQELLRDPQLTNFYVNLLQPSSRCFEIMENNGVLIDLDRYEALRVKLVDEIATLQKQAEDMMPARMKHAHGDNLSLSRAKIISDFMFGPRGLNLTPIDFTEKSKAPSTAYNHLLKFQDDPVAEKFIDVYKQFNSATKTLSTYVVGFLKHIRSDGKFHASYILHRSDDGGTNTGRLSCTGPALQTIPKHTKWAKPLRYCFVAPPGHKLVEVDFSQGELRVMACVANETKMIESYNMGLDLHTVAGSQALGLPFEEVMALKNTDNVIIDAHGFPMTFKQIRQNGKASNFGLIYGMSAGGYMNYARDSYGVKMSLEQAEYTREAFFHLYPGLEPYHRTYKNFAHNHGYVRSPLGRVRHLPMINARDSSVRSQEERRSINAPIQSTLSDLTQLAQVEFYARYGYDTPVKFCMMTHDSLHSYIPEDRLDIWIPRIVDTMQTLRLKEQFGWDPQVEFTAEAEYGDDLTVPNEYDMS